MAGYANSGDELREVWWIHYGRYLHQRLQGQPTQQITGVQGSTAAISASRRTS